MGGLQPKSGTHGFKVTYPNNLRKRVISRNVWSALASIVIVSLFLWQNKSRTHAGLSKDGNRRSDAAVVDSNAADREKNPVHNRTLGFQQIFATVMPERKDRKAGLVLAAAVTDVDITIVDGTRKENISQKEWPHNFHAADEGPIPCAVSHLRLWTRLVEEKIETALLLEDDADWDPRLRSQLAGFADAARQHTNEAFTTEDLVFGSPYGTYWDVIWLGHCGAQSSNFTAYSDPTAPPREHEYSLWGANLFAEDARSAGMRLVSSVEGIVCMYGYGISRIGAEKLIRKWSGMDMAVDLWLSSLCREGYLKCIMPWPQLISAVSSPSNMRGEWDNRAAQLTQDVTTKALQYSARINGGYVLAGLGPEYWIGQW